MAGKHKMALKFEYIGLAGFELLIKNDILHVLIYNSRTAWPRTILMPVWVSETIYFIMLTLLSKKKEEKRKEKEMLIILR